MKFRHGRARAEAIARRITAYVSLTRLIILKLTRVVNRPRMESSIFLNSTCAGSPEQAAGARDGNTGRARAEAIACRITAYASSTPPFAQNRLGS